MSDVPNLDVVFPRSRVLVRCVRCGFQLHPEVVLSSAPGASNGRNTATCSECGAHMHVRVVITAAESPASTSECAHCGSLYCRQTHAVCPDAKVLP